MKATDPLDGDWYVDTPQVDATTGVTVFQEKNRGGWKLSPIIWILILRALVESPICQKHLLVPMF